MKFAHMQLQLASYSKH